MSERDEGLRSSCFGQLAILCAEFGADVPYRGGLDRRFAFRGERVPYLTPAKGIFRARVQRGDAALSVNTSLNSAYEDAETDDGFHYAYQAGGLGHPDNKALRRAYELQVPIVYFIATRAGWYRPEFPCWVTRMHDVGRYAVIERGAMAGPVDDREPRRIDDPIERRYVFRETRVRVHQARFRGRILPAYRSQCAMCRLKETRLLDAAHIIGDPESHGVPVVANGLCLCSIHHRAFDKDLVGVSPDYEVRVSRDLLDDEDGPMLELLKGFHGQPLEVPKSVAQRPDRERLAERYERFLARAS
jgi:putative restriction endonuclease